MDIRRHLDQNSLEIHIPCAIRYTVCEEEVKVNSFQILEVCRSGVGSVAQHFSWSRFKFSVLLMNI